MNDQQITSFQAEVALNALPYDIAEKFDHVLAKKADGLKIQQSHLMKAIYSELPSLVSGKNMSLLPMKASSSHQFASILSIAVDLSLRLMVTLSQRPYCVEPKQRQKSPKFISFLLTISIVSASSCLTQQTVVSLEFKLFINAHLAGYVHSIPLPTWCLYTAFSQVSNLKLTMLSPI